MAFDKCPLDFPDWVKGKGRGCAYIGNHLRRGYYPRFDSGV